MQKIEVLKFEDLKERVNKICADLTLMKPEGDERAEAIKGLLKTEDMVRQDKEMFILKIDAAWPEAIFDPNELVEAAVYDDDNSALLVIFNDGTEYTWTNGGGVMEFPGHTGSNASELDWEYGPSSFVSVLKKKEEEERTFVAIELGIQNTILPGVIFQTWNEGVRRLVALGLTADDEGDERRDEYDARDKQIVRSQWWKLPPWSKDEDGLVTYDPEHEWWRGGLCSRYYANGPEKPEMVRLTERRYNSTFYDIDID